MTAHCMNSDATYRDELVFAGRNAICDYVERDDIRTIRLSGCVLLKDIKDYGPLYKLMNNLSGDIILDFCDVSEFDSMMYTILIWVRLFSSIRGLSCTLHVREGAAKRLTLSGVNQWVELNSIV